MNLSALGMGCMRLPTKEGFTDIDTEAAEKLIAYAMERGINYYDTAWGYHGGKSETVMGEILKKYPRDSFYLASKFPGYSLDNMDKVEEIFEEQLKKCQVEYFDFYLFHNVCESNIDGYLNPKFGILDYLIKQKKNGRIRHLGFSTHGTLETMQRFLDAYGEHMEFCQIQLNYIDLTLQNAKAKLELLKKYELPVIVMEPVRGGKLASIAPEYEEMLRAQRPDMSIPEWAFRFIQTIPNIIVTLSGMSNLAQLKENLDTYDTHKPLTDAELKTLLDTADAMMAVTSLPCTSCRYCVTYCPTKLDIPRIIELYNEHTYSGGGFLPTMAINAMGEGKKPSDCVGCKACEAVCPQNIAISKMMGDFSKKLNAKK